LKPELCATIQDSFSDYLDGAVSGHRMQAISQHLFGESESGVPIAPCDACAREFAAWRLTQDALATLGPAKAPADLGLRLRLAISHENARRSVRLRDRISLAWNNAVRPMLVQVSAGFAGTVLLVGGIVSLLGYVAVPQPVLANDEPQVATIGPRYLYSTTASGDGAIVTGQDAAIVVEAAVDSSGRVYDYAIVSGPQTDEVRTQVESHLLGSVFQPASVFGLPVRSHVVVTFAGISVHG
jgi:hypothetical protein